jgi:hypothetical protein
VLPLFAAGGDITRDGVDDTVLIGRAISRDRVSLYALVYPAEAPAYDYSSHVIKTADGYILYTAGDGFFQYQVVAFFHGAHRMISVLGVLSGYDHHIGQSGLCQQLVGRSKYPILAEVEKSIGRLKAHRAHVGYGCHLCAMGKFGDIFGIHGTAVAHTEYCKSQLIHYTSSVE